jgi:16S rRNA (adenine1518-N6/adenine1519-N6)-dimethyltransferase
VYGVPSAKAAWYADTARIATVPPKVFWPVPNVDSGLVRIERRDPPETAASREATFRVIDAAFGQRRKMLRAALSPLFGSAAAASDAIERAGQDPQARGETLDVAAFAAIAAQLPPTP